MRRIRAAVLENAGAERPYARSRPLRLAEIDLADPGPGEVLVRIEAAGVCHSDLSVVDGNRPRPLPMVLGHESAGIVEAVGPGVEDLSVGQRVVSAFLPRCGHCEGCRTDGKLPCISGTEANTAGTLLSGERRLSEAGTALNHHLGVSAFASHAVIDRRSLVAVGDDVPPEVAAVLGCAVLTGGGALLNAARPEPGQDILVLGLGGVGMAALLVAIAWNRREAGTGRVIAVDTNAEKCARALHLGADTALIPEQLSQEATSAHVVIEAAGHPMAFESAFGATAPGGTLVTVGLPAPGATSRIEPLALTAGARTIIGSYMGSAVPEREIPYYEQLWRDGQLPVGELVSGHRKLEEINEAMDELAEGRAVRQILVFG